MTDAREFRFIAFRTSSGHALAHGESALDALIGGAMALDSRSDLAILDCHHNGIAVWASEMPLSEALRLGNPVSFGRV